MNGLVDFSNHKSKRDFLKHLDTLKGVHQVSLKKGINYHTRYKYYFGHVIPVIQDAQLFVDENGAINDPRIIHQGLKNHFNRIVQLSGDQFSMHGGSTADMSDGDFIQKYEEQVIAFFSQQPYYLEFLTREQWAQQRKDFYNSINNKYVS
jgi:hypothetical protein